MKYAIYKSGNKLIAVSTYAGKRVRGVAKCDPLDNYDEAKGIELAEARCNSKIAHKRRDRAFERFQEARAALEEAQKYCDRMEEYYTDSWHAMYDADEAVENILNNL